jgi:uncharacterized protein YjiK
MPATRQHKNGRITASEIRMNTSEIAVHPITDELYILSATDHILIVADQAGQVKQMERLDRFVFNKPEGISFFSNGDMFITNEGQQGTPTVIRFNYRLN